MLITNMEISGQIRRVSIGFLLSCLLAIFAGMYMFYYASENYRNKSIVLGTKVENSDDSLFGNKVWLAKTASNPGVFAIIGNQKHLIRNEEVFNSYDFSFKNVRVISEGELNKYKLARLVKERGTGRTYFLSYGNNLKKYHHSPQAFAAYRSNSWSDVIEVSSRDINLWNDAVLLKTADDAKVYFITKDNKKAVFPSENEFINAGFQWGDILTVNKTDLASYTEVEYNINLVRERKAAAAGGSGGSSPPPSSPPSPQTSLGAQLIVSADSSSPSASLFPFSTAGNVVFVLKLQAAGGRVDVSGIKITKQGILKQDYITSIAIEDANGVELGRTTAINDNAGVVEFSGGALIVPRNSHKILRVKASFGAGELINHTVSFGVLSEADIKTAAPAAISGIFPLFGGTHKLVISSGLVGQVEIGSEAVSNAARDVNIGTKSELAAKFNLTEISGNENARLERLTLTNWGSARPDDINNITLYSDRKAVATVNDMQNKKVIFNLAGKNLSFSKSDPLQLEIKIDIVGGQASTLKLVIERPGDVEVVGLSQGYNLVVGSRENFPVGSGGSDGFNKITFKHGGIGFFASKIDEEDREIYREKTDSLIGQFELRNTNQNIFLQRMRLQIEKHNSAPDFNVNLTLRDETNKKAIVSIPYERVAGGAVADFSLVNYQINAGKAVIIKVLGDVPKEAVTNNAYRIIVKEFTYKIGLDNTEYRHAEETAGQLMRVFAPRATLAAAALDNGGAVVAGSEATELGSFSIAAAADEQIKIIGINAALTTSSDDVNYVGGFANLALYSGRRRISSVIAEPNSRSYIFSNLNIRIGAGDSLIIKIKADIEGIAGGRTVQFKIETITAEGYYSKAPVIVEGEGAASGAVNITKPAE